MPVSRVPGKGVFPHLLDRDLPGMIAVLSNGKRFTNESESYHDMALLLASPRSSYVAGQDIVVDGIGDSHLLMLEQGVEAFRKVFDVHLTGTFLVSREVGRGMVARGPRAIVNLSSIAGLTGLPKRNAYGAAKAGIIALTRAMTCECAGKGVRVNAVVPAFVETALVRKLAAAAVRLPRLVGGHQQHSADATKIIRGPCNDAEQRRPARGFAPLKAMEAR